MFQWLKNRRERIEASRRAIFRFWDGIKWRYADPMAIAQHLDEDPEYDAATTPRLLQLQDMDAFFVTVRATRRAFGVQEWTQETGGLTVQETMALLRNYFLFTESVKKNTEDSANSPPSTELGNSKESSEPTTNGFAHSGSTSTESESSVPIESASA
jgi:hypothetical protein